MPTRPPEQWFEQLRQRLRHGYVHRIIKEFAHWLKYRSTPASAKPTLKRVQHYLTTHRSPLQDRQVKKLGFPIGSGMVESACKWLLTQRLKGTGRRWSENGLNHLLPLRLARVNERFDSLFGDLPLPPTLYAPNR